MIDPFGAQWSYESLRLQVPSLACGGLWRVDGKFYVHVPDLGSSYLGPDGRPLEDWFRDNSALFADVSLVAALPESATRIPERSIEDVALLRGLPRTRGQLLIDLSMLLPRAFPPFTLSSGGNPPFVAIIVDGDVGSEIQNEAMACIESMGLPYEFAIERSDKPFVEAAQGADPTGTLQLPAGRGLGSACPGAIRRLVEKDEDEWLGRRTRLFATDDLSPAEILPTPFNNGLSRCVVSTTLPPRDLRVLLSLYDVVTVVCPLDQAHEETLAGFRVNEDELLQLVQSKRVQFLLPQSVRRYRQGFLARLCDEAPEGLLFSRSLAAATVTEIKRRVPYLFPPLGMAERVEVLAALDKAAKAAAGPSKLFAEVLLRECSRQWLDGEAVVHRRGAMAGVSLGLSPIIAELWKRQTGRDLLMEITGACQIVEWAAVLRGTAVPGVAAGYSEQNATELCASAYSGVSSQPGSVLGAVDEIALGVLAIENDAPVLDVAKAFAGDDVNRLRAVIHGIADDAIDATQRAAAIATFNERVTKYERNADRVTKLDLAALAGAVGTLAAAALDLKTSGAFSLGTWLLKRSLTGPSLEGKLGGRLADTWRGANAWTKSDVVLVSRIRGKIAR